MKIQYVNALSIHESADAAGNTHVVALPYDGASAPIRVPSTALVPRAGNPRILDVELGDPDARRDVSVRGKNPAVVSLTNAELVAAITAERLRWKDPARNEPSAPPAYARDLPCRGHGSLLENEITDRLSELLGDGIIMYLVPKGEDVLGPRAVFATMNMYARGILYMDANGAFSHAQSFIDDEATKASVLDILSRYLDRRPVGDDGKPLDGHRKPCDMIVFK